MDVLIERKYEDIEGIKRTLDEMVKVEPGWAANRIREGEKAAARIESLTARVAELEEVLTALTLLKQHKDIRGKDQHYLDNQPSAWSQAFKVLRPPPETSE